MTTMQFVIVGQFLMCYTLPLVLDVMDTKDIMNGAAERNKSWIYLLDLSNMLVIANSALRILVYYTFLKEFRQRMFSMFRRSFTTREPDNYSSAFYSYTRSHRGIYESLNNRFVIGTTV